MLCLYFYPQTVRNLPECNFAPCAGALQLQYDMTGVRKETSFKLSVLLDHVPLLNCEMLKNELSLSRAVMSCDTRISFALILIFLIGFKERL